MARVSSYTWAQVQVCQTPRSLRRKAGRVPRRDAWARKSFAKVSSAFGLSPAVAKPFLRRSKRTIHQRGEDYNSPTIVLGWAKAQRVGATNPRAKSPGLGPPAALRAPDRQADRDAG